MKEMWQRELGVTMEPRQAEWKVFLNDQSHLNYDTSRSSWIGDYNDANTFLDMFMSNNGNNRTGWTNFTYDALVRDANLQTDLAKRERLLQQAETMLVRDELPILPLFFYVGIIFFDPDEIEGIYFNVVDDHPLRDIRKKTNAKSASDSPASNGAYKTDQASRVPHPVSSPR
jgi:oligopeptide transport system substrate-binding protein